MTTAPARCPSCGHDRGKLGPEKGPHVASWLCERCGRFLHWISRRDLGDLEDFDLTNAPIPERPR
jgi:hypothetical protein